MKKINDIPAFPQTIDDMGTLRSFNEGMTLKDYFAGQALHGLCANQSYVAAIATDESLNDEDKPHKLAEICYELANAMLLERYKI